MATGDSHRTRAGAHWEQRCFLSLSFDNRFNSMSSWLDTRFNDPEEPVTAKWAGPMLAQLSSGHDRGT